MNLSDKEIDLYKFIKNSGAITVKTIQMILGKKLLGGLANY